MPPGARGFIIASSLLHHCFIIASSALRPGFVRASSGVSLALQSCFALFVGFLQIFNC